MKIGLYATGAASAGYRELLDQVQYADQVGFDSVWLRERHFHTDDQGRNFFASPFVAAAYIAARTESIRIGIGARILPLDHPIHIAEDAATVDVISRGRLDLGIARIGENDLYQSAFGITSDQTRGRFEEALDVILAAWTKTSFSYEGQHFTLPTCTVSPRPVQRPHPPVYLVGIGPATLNFGAKRGFPLLLAAAQTAEVVARTQRHYAELLEQNGFDAKQVVLPVNRFVYVAESNAEAVADTKETIMRFVHRENSVIRDFLMLPPEQITYDLLFNEVCIFGDADYCANRLNGLSEQVDVRHLIVSFNYFTIDHAKSLRSMRRFVGDVMPRLRGARREPVTAAAR
jgi:alkanesulfonate monooxygenase SsuD/methylene tetrahydromethanopterin reductase-like flavin-dependent oxidoreductase (luciferase family)